MTTLFRVAAGLALVSASALAQPAINSGGVLNAASYSLQGLPNSGIARGSLFVVFGQRMGPAALATAGFPLPTTLAGTSIRVTVAGTSVDALMVYTSANQVAAVLPSATPEGTGTITVSFNGTASATQPIRVVRSSFGIFTVNQAGSGPGIITNYITDADRPVNALTRPARPGQVVTIWGTGLGPVSGNEAAGPILGDVPGNVEVIVGGRNAAVLGKSRSGCCAGLDQINVTVPEGVEGCYVPVVVRTPEATSNFSTISVSRTNTCTDPNGLTSQQITDAQSRGSYSVGGITLSRTAIKISMQGLEANSTVDAGAGFFSRYRADQLLASQGVFGGTSSVANGSCTILAYRPTEEEPVDPIQATPLDAGPAITVTGPRGTKQMTKAPGAQGGYFAAFASSISIPDFPGPFPGGEPPFLDPGAYTISAPGGTGADSIGGFNINFNMPQMVNWTNIPTGNVNRASDFRVTWSGGAGNDTVQILGFSGNETAAAMFICQERASAGQFNIPSYILQSLPATAGDETGFMSVSGVSALVPFSAPRLDAGAVMSVSGNGSTVRYQ